LFAWSWEKKKVAENSKEGAKAKRAASGTWRMLSLKMENREALFWI
jgi:hypothetical protein